MFQLNDFIAKYVIKRPQSMFLKDVDDKREKLIEKICNKSVLVLEEQGQSVHHISKQYYLLNPRH